MVQKKTVRKIRKERVRTKTGSSKRARVKVAFEEGGVEAALEMAEKLRVRPARAQRWVGKWRELTAPPKVKRRRPAAPVQEGQLVCMTWDVDIQATLLHKGPEQSEIKFANGNRRIVVNEWLRPAE